jgi:glutathione S-transferase
MEQLRSALERMDHSLQAGPWLVGEMFTLADVSILPTVVRIEDLELTYLWDDLPTIQDWYTRIQARPSFAAAYYPGTRDFHAFSGLETSASRPSAS